MDFEPKSLAEMSAYQKSKYWPNLSSENYHKTSEETKDYNCVGWVNNITNEPIDLSLDEEGDPIPNFDVGAKPYIEYFKKFGFIECADSDLIQGIEKIALFEGREGYFEHVAKQLANGHWTSKVGEFEDIEHYNLESLENPNNYGKATFFMQRPIH